MRVVELFGPLTLCVLLTSGSVHAQHGGYSDENRRLQYSIAQAVRAATAAHGAILDHDDVYVDPDPENTEPTMPDVLVKISVDRPDCSAVVTIARTIETITLVLSSQMVKRIKVVAILTGTKIDGRFATIDRRDLSYDSMLALRNRGARTSQYLELGMVQPVSSLKTAVIPTCPP